MQENKLIVTGDYIDTNTGIRFVEDIRGNYHCIMQTSMDIPTIEIYEEEVPIEIPQIEIPPTIFESGWFTFTPSITVTPEINLTPDITVSIDLATEKDKEIFDLLSENAWLWGVIEQAIKDRKDKNANYAMVNLEKAIAEGKP